MEGLNHDVQSPAQENMMQTPAEGIRQSTTSTKPTPRKLVIDAIRHLKNPKGSSFADIRKFLTSAKTELDDADLKKMKTYMAVAVERGVLLKEDGKYKIKETAAKKKQAESKTTTRRKRSDSKKSARRKGKSGSPKGKTRSKKRSAERKIKKSSPTRKRRSSKKSAA